VYSFAKDSAAIEALDAGVTVTQSFTETVSDGDGDAVQRNYVIQITGADDASTLGSVPSGSIVEVDQSSTTTDLNLTGTLTGADHQTYVEVPFDVPPGVERLTLSF
jgi:predicted RNA-binding protein with TRAM domain